MDLQTAHEKGDWTAVAIALGVQDWLAFFNRHPGEAVPLHARGVPSDGFGGDGGLKAGPAFIISTGEASSLAMRVGNMNGRGGISHLELPYDGTQCQAGEVCAVYRHRDYCEDWNNGAFCDDCETGHHCPSCSMGTAMCLTHDTAHPIIYIYRYN